MDSIIYLRIKELCEENNININKLETEIGLSKSSIAKWRSTTTPTVDKISSVASYFGVSLDYLVGATDIRQPADSIMCDRDFISIQRARERLSDKDKDRMMAMLKIGFDYAFDDSEKPDLSAILKETK